MKHFYICYSDSKADKELYLALHQRLEFLEGRKRLTFWSQHRLQPGAIIENEIRGNLDRADVVLMLVSSDFFDQSRFRKLEYDLAVARGAAGLCLVVPVVLRSMYGWQDAEIGIYPPAREGRPITIAPDLDAAWSEVIQWIEQIFTAVAQEPIPNGKAHHDQTALIQITSDIAEIRASQSRMETRLDTLISLSESQKAEVGAVLHQLEENRFTEAQMIEALQWIDEVMGIHAAQLSKELKAAHQDLKAKDLEVKKRFKLSIPIIPTILSYEMDIEDNSKRSKSAQGFWKGLQQGRVLL